MINSEQIELIIETASTLFTTVGHIIHDKFPEYKNCCRELFAEILYSYVTTHEAGKTEVEVIVFDELKLKLDKVLLISPLRRALTLSETSSVKLLF